MTTNNEQTQQFINQLKEDAKNSEIYSGTSEEFIEQLLNEEVEAHDEILKNLANRKDVIMKNEAFVRLMETIKQVELEGESHSFWTDFSKDEYELDVLEEAVERLRELEYYAKISENSMLPNSYIIAVDW